MSCYREEGPRLDPVGGVTHLDELYGQEGPCLHPVGGVTHLDELHGEEGPRLDLVGGVGHHSERHDLARWYFSFGNEATLHDERFARPNHARTPPR